MSNFLGDNDADRCIFYILNCALHRRRWNLVDESSGVFATGMSMNSGKLILSHSRMQVQNGRIDLFMERNGSSNLVRSGCKCCMHIVFIHSSHLMFPKDVEEGGRRSPAPM
eukprot:747982-Hanusia_phi.AAC.1